MDEIAKQKQIADCRRGSRIKTPGVVKPSEAKKTTRRAKTKPGV
jgi:hypothetical protein